MKEAVGLETDGVLISETFIEDGKFHRALYQPTRTAILERNQDLRNSPGALKSLDSMGLELTIPMVDYIALKEKNPDLGASCPVARRTAWVKFLGSPESEPYRVRPRNHVNKSSIIIPD